MAQTRSHGAEPPRELHDDQLLPLPTNHPIPPYPSPNHQRVDRANLVAFARARPSMRALRKHLSPQSRRHPPGHAKVDVHLPPRPGARLRRRGHANPQVRHLASRAKTETRQRGCIVGYCPGPPGSRSSERGVFPARLLPRHRRCEAVECGGLLRLKRAGLIPASLQLVQTETWPS